MMIATVSMGSVVPWRELRPRLQVGFSLLELLVSVSLVMLLIPFVVGLQIGAMKMNTGSLELDAGVWAAQAKMEELRLEPFAAVVDGTQDIQLGDGRVLTMTWSVRQNQPEAGLKMVTIEVVDSSNEDADPTQMILVKVPE